MIRKNHARRHLTIKMHARSFSVRTWFPCRNARFQSIEWMNDYSDGGDAPVYVSLDDRASSSQENGGPYDLPYVLDGGSGAGYQDIERIAPARYLTPKPESVQGEVQVASDVVLAMKLAALEARMAALCANEPSKSPITKTSRS
jgi:hypothetical protein